MFSGVRAEISERLTEVFQLVEHIQHLEGIPPAPDPPEVKILRGLFFVHLYATLERAVNQGVQRFLEGVANLEICPSHLEARFLSVALDPVFSSFRNVGEEKSWNARLRFLDVQSSQMSQPVNSGMFGLYLQNIWFERLEVIFRCFNIDQPVVPIAEYGLYIDELVNNRNGVAHGRFSALGIGSHRRSPDLLIRYNAISDTCIHIVNCLDRQLAVRGFVRQGHIEAYPQTVKDSK